jgi:prolyl-tRNA synthetase
MAQAYRNIFDRFGLRYRAVAADSGAIGGDLSEEFQVIAATGEDAIVYCPDSNTPPTWKRPRRSPRPARALRPPRQLEKTPTPGKSTCADVAELLGVPLSTTIKSLVLATDVLDDAGNIEGLEGLAAAAARRPRHERDQGQQAAGPGPGLPLRDHAEIDAHFGCKPGYLGPLNLVGPRSSVVADREVAVMADWITGANEVDFHMTGVNWGRDLPEPALVADMRNVVAGDASPDGKGVLAIERGIEVGHVFVLGTKYSKRHERHLPRRRRQAAVPGDGLLRHRHHPPAGRRHRAEPRRARHHLARRAGAVHRGGLPDRHGPQRRGQGSPPRRSTKKLLAAGVDVLLDDRGERPGAMFADWELIGVPHRVVISDRGLKEGQFEYQHRRDTAATKVPSAAAP